MESPGGQQDHSIKLPSLRLTLVRFIGGPVVVVFLILFGVIFFSTGLVIREILDQQTIVVNSVADQVSSYLDSTDRLIHILEDAVGHVESSELENFFQETRKVYPRFNVIFLLDKNGTVLLESSDFPTNLKGLDLSGEPFFKAQDEGGTFFSDPFVSLFSDQVVVTAATPIYLEDMFSSVLVAELNLELLQETIDQIGVDEGITFVVDSKGTYVAHPDQELVQQRQYFYDTSLLDQGQSGQDVFEITRDEEVSRWLISSITKVRWNWYIITQQPLLSVLSPLLFILIAAIVTFALTVLVLFVRVRRTFEKVSLPLKTLAGKAEVISQGNYEDFPESTSGEYREVISLENSFTRMVEAIQSRDQYLEQRVEERTEQLAQANQDLESFMYSVSHDLRAPLRSIEGFSDYLKEEYFDVLDETGQLYLSRIQVGSVRMDALINDLLNLSRLGRKALQLERVDLMELAEEIYTRIAESSPDHRPELVITPSQPVSADRHMMDMMLYNLISNAFKFTRNVKTPKIEIGLQTKDGQETYYVRDNGVGFEMANAENLFVPFQRLHPEEEFEGTGIGLAIVHRVIRSHGGEIWAEAEKDNGATFYFTLN